MNLNWDLFAGVRCVGYVHVFGHLMGTVIYSHTHCMTGMLAYFHPRSTVLIQAALFPNIR